MSYQLFLLNIRARLSYFRLPNALPLQIAIDTSRYQGPCDLLPLVYLGIIILLYSSSQISKNSGEFNYLLILFAIDSLRQYTSFGQVLQVSTRGGPFKGSFSCVLRLVTRALLNDLWPSAIVLPAKKAYSRVYQQYNSKYYDYRGVCSRRGFSRANRVEDNLLTAYSQTPAGDKLVIQEFDYIVDI